MRMYTAPAFRKIVLPFLEACDCKFALELAKAIAGKGDVVLIGLVQAEPTEPFSASASQARRVRQMMRQCADGERVKTANRVRVAEQVNGELFKCIQEEEKSDLLLLEYPCHFEALSASLDEIMHRTVCNIAVVRAPSERPPKKILVPVRGGRYAELALRISLAIARSTGASVSSLHIIPTTPDKPYDPHFQGLAQVLPQLSEIDSIEMQMDNPVKAILDEARYYDMVILGSSALAPDHQDGIGPIANRIFTQCPVPVMMVKTCAPLPYETESEHTGQTAISVLVDKWFAENTFHANEFSALDQLLDLKRKQGLTISVALPALNEEKTVGKVIQTIKSALMDSIPLLDEIVLMDSNSDDRTREIAAGLGVPVYIHQETLQQYGARKGKGEALWKSLFTTRGDILVWIDTDIVNIHPRFVYGLLGPLLVDPQIKFVKGFYRRPIKVGNRIQAGGGGRVTELTARPLLNLFYPELSGLVQPLSGEYAGRRETLERLPFSSGYGVEIGLLIDILESNGLDSIAQVDLLERIHHNQALESLSKMSFAIIQTVIRKLERRYGRNMIDDVNKTMKLIRYEPGRLFLDIERISEQERPPMIDLPAYQTLHLSRPEIR